jgi:hypothetical protein
VFTTEMTSYMPSKINTTRAEPVITSKKLRLPKVAVKSISIEDHSNDLNLKVIDNIKLYNEIVAVQDTFGRKYKNMSG